MARAALFDVDGTLVDTNDLHASAWRQAFLHFGHDLAQDVIRGQVGKGGDNLIPTLLPELDEGRAKAIEDYRSDLFKRDYLARAVPFPGVRELFLRMRESGVTIVLASSAGEAEVAYHLALIGCEDLVSATTSKDEVGASKPCPDIFEAALRKIGPLGREDAVVIGDSPWDVKAAAKAGLRTIGFRSGGFEDATLIEAGAFVLYDGPRHLLADYENSVFAKEEEGPRAQGGRGVGEGARALCETPLIKALSPIAALGDQPQLRILCGAVIAVGLFGGDRRLARTGWRMLAAHTFATWTKDFVKHRVDRVRPRALAEKGEDATPEPGNSHAKELTSFPSGHSAGAAAVARAYARDYPEHQGPAYAAAAVLAAVQVPRCAHYPTDIGAGLAIGVAAEAAVSRLVPGLGSD